MPQHSRRLLMQLALIVALTLGAAGAGRAAGGGEIDIPFQKFTLPNGLTLVVHEDHKAPIAAVNIWYHVGSKNERPGKTGFAHLFEHLMFNGSEHFNDDYFQAMERAGATNLNGTTSFDRTNYFQNVPSSALDTALWMESDRMGHLLGAIDQAKLDEQRGVVQNEKRQGENQPYAIGYELTMKNCFPVGHPYSWTVIGSMDDLSSASLHDVHEWFKKYYGPANAVLVVAGDVDAQAVRQKVEKYFGDIPSGPPVVRPPVWIAKRSGTVRQVAQDRVPQSVISKTWNVPQWGTREAACLDLAAGVLAMGKTSRLYKRLVYDEQIATAASADNQSMEIAGMFEMQAMAKPGADLKQVERALDDELAKLLKYGPTEQELKRVKTQLRMSYIRGLEQIGGFGGKSDRLAESATYAGDPGAWKKYLQDLGEATAEEIVATARKWLSDGVYILEIHPFPQYATVKSGVDRTTLPQAGAPPEVKFPELKRATLSNGMKVILVERGALPLVDMTLQIEGGDAADPAGKPGVAGMTLSMLDEGTSKRAALEISEALDNLGAGLGAGAGQDTMSVSLSTLKENLAAALEIYGDVILHPAFPEADFARIKKQKLAGLRQAKASPTAMAARVAPRLVFGADHPYGAMETEASVGAIAREDLVKFHQAWFKPNHATLIVAGATTLEELTPKLEALFREWTPGETPRIQTAEANSAAAPAIYLIDKPQAEQSYILAAQIAPPRSNPDEIAIETMNQILGGTFTSRINMNLREGKHWTYGARSGFGGGRGPRQFAVTAPVQTDKTRDALLEIMKELTGIQKAHPVTAAEFAKTQTNKILKLGGTWETMGSIQGAVAGAIAAGLPADYYQGYPGKLRALTLDTVNRVARETLHPERMLWVVVGDRAKIEAPLRGLKELGFGEVKVIDADGNAVK